VVYVGPTLRRGEVLELLPGAEVAPPAGVGDVLRATNALVKHGIAHVSRLVIIDGYFERMAAVWHKEILVAMSHGISVWGAASMGALRAAELAPFGMRGIGSIFNDYARGVLTADDEVAVAHAPADFGYLAMSDALVNIRYGLAAAVQERILDEATSKQLLELARGRFYRERSWEQLIRDGRAAGISAKALDALASWPKPDRKADDARMLLRRLRNDKAGRARTMISVPRTWALRQLESLLR